MVSSWNHEMQKGSYKAMRRILQDDEVRQKMGEKSYEILTTRFSLENAVNGFFSAIQFACQTLSWQFPH